MTHSYYQEHKENVSDMKIFLKNKQKKDKERPEKYIKV